MTVTQAATIDEVTLRDLKIDDLDAYIDYWHDPTNVALEAIGVDRTKIYSAKKMREMLTLTLAKNAKLPNSQLSVIVIQFRNRAIGVHELTEMEVGESAVMHAHVWDKTLRGRGIGMISYVKAMDLYFQRFGFSTIRFETPKANKGALRIKEKLGLEKTGTGTFNIPILKAPIPTDTFLVTPDQIPALYNTLRIRSAA